MSKLKALFICFILQAKKEVGATAVMFAIMFPMVLMFYSFAFDGANIQAERARLADGLNQGALAVAITDNQNKTAEAEQKNKQLLQSYLHYYLPGANIPVDDLAITVDYHYDEKDKSDLKSVDYRVSGTAIVHPILANKSGSKAPGFDQDIHIKADRNVGIVRRTYEKVTYPTDYVFVTDFSASMTLPSAESGMNRIKLLQSVVKEFITQVLQENEDTTIGIVPFSVGVPVVTNIKNLAGGNEVGCSFVGKLLPEYKDVNFDFWYNKKRQTALYSEKKAAYNYDSAIYTHYSTIVGPATGKSTAQMVTSGWCQKNSSFGAAVGNAHYSCDADPRSRLSEHKDEFSRSYRAAYKLMSYAYDNSIANIYTLDFEATFDDDPYYIFSEEAVTTYTHFFDTDINRPFYHMCSGALPSSPSPALMKTIAKPKSYLIELTSDVGVLDEFSKMSVGGNTDSNSGLLRALPVIAKGTNPRKIIIVISDGDDNLGSQLLTDKLHKEYKLCDRIKSGLLRYPDNKSTKEVDIYFISVIDDKTTGSRINFWGDYCTGSEKALVATNYKKLLNALIGISRKASTKFINNDG